MKKKESSLKRGGTANMRMTWQAPRSSKLQEVEPNTSGAGLLGKEKLDVMDLAKGGLFAHALE